MFNGEKIGYAKTFINDPAFWEEKIIPLLETRVKEEWVYSAAQHAEIKKMELEAENEEE